jgi:hypothetical protein
LLAGAALVQGLAFNNEAGLMADAGGNSMSPLEHVVSHISHMNVCVLVLNIVRMCDAICYDFSERWRTDGRFGRAVRKGGNWWEGREMVTGDR